MMPYPSRENGVPNTKLCKDTPSVVVRDNRGLTVRNVEYNRIIEGGERQLYVTRHVFDASGALRSSADPVRALQPSATPNFSYKRMLSDQQIRIESIDAGTQVQLYDARGLLLWLSTSNHYQQRWEYDALGRSICRFERAADASKESCRERLFYGDANSEAGQNLRGRLIRHEDPTGRVCISNYALTGESLTETRRFLKQLEEPDWPEDDAACEALLESECYTTRWTHNALGEILTQTDAAGHHRRYTQNLTGQLKAAWLQLVDQVERSIAADLTYNVLGKPLQVHMGNGIVRTYEYEATTQRLYRLSTLRKSDNTTLQDLHYTHDPVGNITRIEDAVQSTRYTRNQRINPAATYEYDACYQLLSATGRESAQASQQGMALPPWQNLDDSQLVNYTRRYTYDAGGNLIKIQHTGAQSYTLNMTVSSRSNRVVPEEWEATPEQVDSYFDASGNLKQLQPGQPLTWNGRNQLSRAVQMDRPSNADDETYIYANTSQRVRKVRRWLASNQQHTEEVRYLPGLEWREQRQADRGEEANADTAQVNERLQVLSMTVGNVPLCLLHWEVGQPEEIANDQARYSLDNHLVSSTLELDGQANKLTYEEYYPYGGTAVWSSKNVSEAKYKYVRYCGKERDATGLYYYGFRYYAPWLGRWLNPDPAGTIDGLNLFRMVRNNPITLIDQDGRWTASEWDMFAQELFKTMPEASQSPGFRNFYSLAQAGEVNVANLNQNCYYCTVSALSGNTTHGVVGETEEMQQDTASLDTIDELFGHAGFRVNRQTFDASSNNSQSVQAAHTNPQFPATPGHISAWHSTYGYLNSSLAPGEAGGLAYTRSYRPEGHMVVVAKDQHGQLGVLDYQSVQPQRLEPNTPPEGAWHQTYHVFLRQSKLSSGHDVDVWGHIPNALKSQRLIIMSDINNNRLRVIENTGDSSREVRSEALPVDVNRQQRGAGNMAKNKAWAIRD